MLLKTTYRDTSSVHGVLGVIIWLPQSSRTRCMCLDVFFFLGCCICGVDRRSLLQRFDVVCFEPNAVFVTDNLLD